MKLSEEKRLDVGTLFIQGQKDRKKKIFQTCLDQHSEASMNQTIQEDKKELMHRFAAYKRKRDSDDISTGSNETFASSFEEMVEIEEIIAKQRKQMENSIH